VLWVVEQCKLWGDYGSILVSGFGHRESKGSPLLLHRAGPFFPPISFPWLKSGGHRIVVSGDFRRELEQSRFAGLRFERAVKDQIILLPWHLWDLSADKPERYPPGGEPGDYIWDKPHSPLMAAMMPEAWELLPPLVPLRLEQLEDPEGGYLDKFLAHSAEETYPSMFLSRHEYGNLVVDDVGREWLEGRAKEWVRFCEVELANA
jgi:hypothetical protein